ncbi:hypothetical protein Tco_1294345 [Tanacetum coccineum]
MHVVEETCKRAYKLLKCRVCTTSMSPPIYERILKAKNTMLGRYAVKSYLEQILSHGFFRDDLLGRYAVESYLEQILSHGFFRADLYSSLLSKIIISSFLNQHPGNIAVDEMVFAAMIAF